MTSFRAGSPGCGERATLSWIECGIDYTGELGLEAWLNCLIGSRGAVELGERQVPRGPRASTSENPAGLTNRELEVLPLLAEGLRNAEIAQRLVLSQKTVDHHVSAILRKLGVSTRGQAGAAAGRLGILARTSGS